MLRNIQKGKIGRYSIEIGTPKPTSGLEGELPTIEEEDNWYSENEAILAEMIAARTASVVDIEAAFAKNALDTYIGGTPKGVNIGSNVCCHGTGVHVTTYRIYKMERRDSRHPVDFRSRYGHYPRLYMMEHGRTTRVGEMRGDKEHGLGRAKGLTGWDSTRDMFAFALASFSHNFEAALGAFSSRPSLPCSEQWTLPNLVYSKRIRERERRWNARIVAPPYAVPPASYSFSFALPTPLIALGVGTKCKEDVRTMCEWWDSDKRNLIDPGEVTFPKGENVTEIGLRAVPPATLQKGYFNINPEKPMVVSYVDVDFPPI